MSTNERDENMVAVVHAAVFSATVAALLGDAVWRTEAKERVRHGDTLLSVNDMACAAAQDAADGAAYTYKPFKA